MSAPRFNLKCTSTSKFTAFIILKIGIGLDTFCLISVICSLIMFFLVTVVENNTATVLNIFKGEDGSLNRLQKSRPPFAKQRKHQNRCTIKSKNMLELLSFI